MTERLPYVGEDTTPQLSFTQVLIPWSTFIFIMGLLAWSGSTRPELTAVVVLLVSVCLVSYLLGVSTGMAFQSWRENRK
jgi:hypothetical protein